MYSRGSLPEMNLQLLDFFYSFSENDRGILVMCLFLLKRSVVVATFNILFSYVAVLCCFFPRVLPAE